MRTVRCCMLLVCVAALLRAAMSPEEQKAVLSYKLSMPVANRLLTALPAMTQYVLSLPDRQARMARAMKQSTQGRIKEMEANEKVMAILKQNSLTPREYIVGVIALRMAVMIANTPAGIAIPTIIASPGG